MREQVLQDPLDHFKECNPMESLWRGLNRTRSDPHFKRSTLAALLQKGLKGSGQIAADQLEG